MLYKKFLQKWFLALKQVFPIYTIMHVLFFLLSLFTPLFVLGDFSTNALHRSTLVQEWNHWDTSQYTTIAQHGYDGAWRTAFFPLFPLLEHIGAFVVRDPFIAGLFVSSVANLLLLTVLYQLVEEDFSSEQTHKSVLYLSVFPSAFFLAAAYTEALFVFLVVLCFYLMRHRRWLGVGIVGCLACLTRSAGIFLLLPCAYEYARQRQIRLDALSILLIPCGLLAYSCYCFVQFGDALSWVHAQAGWNRQQHDPITTLYLAMNAIVHGTGILSFPTLHNLLDLASVLFALCMCVVIAKWNSAYRAYKLYAIPLILFLLSAPVIGNDPLQSMPRFMLEIFPIFIAASSTRAKYAHDAYVILSLALLCVSCLLFLTGHWMV